MGQIKNIKLHIVTDIKKDTIGNQKNYSVCLKSYSPGVLKHPRGNTLIDPMSATMTNQESSENTTIWRDYSIMNMFGNDKPVQELWKENACFAVAMPILLILLMVFVMLCYIKRNRERGFKYSSMGKYKG